MLKYENFIVIKRKELTRLLHDPAYVFTPFNREDYVNINGVKHYMCGTLTHTLCQADGPLSELVVTFAIYCKV